MTIKKVEWSIQHNSHTGGMTKCCCCKRQLERKESYIQQIIGSQRFRHCFDCAADYPEEITKLYKGGE